MLVSVCLLVVLFVVLRRHQRARASLFFAFVLWFYLLVLTSVVFFPIRLSQDWPANITAQNAMFTLSRVNYIPLNFGGLFSSNPSVMIEQLAGNILLTMPLGFLMPFLVRITARRMIWLALLAGFALEGLQLLFKLLGVINGYGHSVDINDAILNTIGVLSGYGLFRCLVCFVKSSICPLKLSSHALSKYIMGL